MINLWIFFQQTNILHNFPEAMRLVLHARFYQLPFLFYFAHLSIGWKWSNWKIKIICCFKKLLLHILKRFLKSRLNDIDKKLHYWTNRIRRSALNGVIRTYAKKLSKFKSYTVWILTLFCIGPYYPNYSRGRDRGGSLMGTLHFSLCPWVLVCQFLDYFTKSSLFMYNIDKL